MTFLSKMRRRQARPKSGEHQVNRLFLRGKERARGGIVYGLSRVATRFGFALRPIGGDYLDAERTIQAAQEAGLSIEDYYYRGSSQQMRGRIDRIVDHIVPVVSSTHPIAVVEIGAGTGVFLRRCLSRMKCSAYHVFETDTGWRSYLSAIYGDHPAYRSHACDGESLRPIADQSVDLVHAHGVFVYTPTLVTLSYIEEAVRVLKASGHLYFDCYLDEAFDLDVRRKWMTSPHRFPIVLPAAYLRRELDRLGLTLVESFRELHGPDYVHYLLARKD